MHIGLGLLLLSIHISEPSASDNDEAHRHALTHYGLGLLRDADHRPTTALHHFETAAKSDPKAVAPRKPLVELYTRLGRDAAALRVAREALDRNPNDPALLQTAATIHDRLKQYRDAEQLLRQAVQCEELSAHPTQQLGILRDWAKAAAAAEDWPALRDAASQSITLLNEKKNHLRNNGSLATLADWSNLAGQAHEQRADALIQLNEFNQAIDAYQTAHRLFLPDHPQAAARLDWNLSGLLLKQGHLNEALVHLDRNLAMQPTSLEPYQRMLTLYHKLDRDAEALTRLRNMVQTHADVEAVHWLYAQQLMASQSDTAIKLFRERMSHSTDGRYYSIMTQAMGRHDAPALLNLLNELFYAVDSEESLLAQKNRQGKIEQLRSLTQAIKAQPQVVASMLRVIDQVGGTLQSSTTEFLAGELERQGKVEDAVTLYRQSDSDDAKAELLSLLARQRRWNDLQIEALRQITARRRQGGGSLRPDVYLATAYAQLGRKREALRALEPLKSVQADGQLWAQLEPLRILTLLGDHEQALKRSTELLQESTAPDDIRQIRLIRSNAYLGLKQYLEAEAELRTILEFYPDDPLTLNNLGYNLAEQGRKLPEAESLIRRAIEIDRINSRASGDAEPVAGTYLDSLGWVLLRRGKLNEAKLILEQALTHADVAADGIVWDHLGDVRFRLGDKLGAADAWQKAIALYADSLQGQEDDRRDTARRKFKSATLP